MYNLSCIIVIFFNCTGAYAQDYTLVSHNRHDLIFCFRIKNYNQKKKLPIYHIKCKFD